MPVQGLLEVGGKELELSLPMPGLVELSQLREVVEQPVAAERGQLDPPEPPRHGERLLGQAATLVSVVRMQQRRVAAHQGCREWLGLAKPSRHVDRVIRQLAGAARPPRRNPGLRPAGPEPPAEPPGPPPPPPRRPRRGPPPPGGGGA